MTDPIPIGAAKGSYLATIKLYRQPDGRISAVLDDMADHQIEAIPSITQRFFKVASWVIESAADLMRQGVRFDEETRALNDDGDL